ncbi:MAG: DUF3825 domain-containing protein, partial [Actinobacteria bacterium]|nr:DUF3825 domain-containing protein [Actinomycetota bacterium]
DVQQELQDVLSDFVYFPERTMDILKEKVPNEKDYKAMLNEDYARAGKEGTIRYSEEKVLFPIRHKRQDGTPIVISIRRSSYATSKLPWYLSYIDSYVKPEKPAGKTGLGHELENFAYLGPWQSFLSALAEKALTEPWDFEGAGRKNYDILKSYIRYTFYRLQLEDKVAIDDDNKFAAFNTGLVNEHYDDIYACFEPEQGDYEWRFAEFCTAGSRGMGKRVVRSFNPLPQPPSYFTRKEDLLFDLEKELIVDYEHILIDGIHRLPVDVLEEECRNSKEALGILGKIHATTDFRRKRSLYRDLADLLEEDHRLFNRLRSRLEYAISLAKRQVRWNYKMAIPSYYPRNNSMSLLMPLSLEDESQVDTALVVELLPSGNYQGQTILTLRQAYLDARLLSRPDSEWLTAGSIQETTEEEYDDGE